MKYAVGILVVFIIGVAAFTLPSDGGIPPTPAWVNIATNDTDASTNPAWANATNYSDDLWIITDGSILIEILPYTGGAE
jgi:hypothetical protein